MSAQALHVGDLALAKQRLSEASDTKRKRASQRMPPSKRHELLAALPMRGQHGRAQAQRAQASALFKQMGAESRDGETLL